jgi:hypothetical protein
MCPKRYLTIDTSTDSSKSNDFELFLKTDIGPDYRRISLKSVYIQHENDVAKLFAFRVNEIITYKPLCVHCSMLSKDDNFVNDRPEGSDVLGIIYPPPETKGLKFIYVKLNNGSGKLISHSNYIRLHLTNLNGDALEKRGTFYIIYEIEFF